MANFGCERTVEVFLQEWRDTNILHRKNKSSKSVHLRAACEPVAKALGQPDTLGEIRVRDVMLKTSGPAVLRATIELVRDAKLTPAQRMKFLERRAEYKLADLEKCRRKDEESGQA